jgi:cellulose biosynthesis protein BcsQ
LRILATYSIKGGVAKTTTAVNLAHLAAQSGEHTLLWDLDPQGAASFYLRVKPRVKGGVGRVLDERRKLWRRARESDFEGLDLLPADFSYRHMDLALDASPRPRKRLARLLAPMSRRYDWIVLDCPPSISLVSESVFRAADVILSPLIPTPLSLRAHAQLQDHLREVKKPPRLLPFFALVDRRKSLHRRVVSRAFSSDPDFLKSAIPYSSQVEEMSARRAPLTAFAPHSRPALAYAALWSELHDRISEADTA